MSTPTQLLNEMHRCIESLFKKFNERFFGNEIPFPIIAIQSSKRQHGTLGWCSVKKIWKNELKNEFYYEIAIVSEFLDRTFYDIASTLLHEMCHLYGLNKGIKDTSRGYRYHNKKFKETAKARGLNVKFDKTLGWAITSLKAEIEPIVDEIFKEETLMLTRGYHRGGEKLPEMEEEGGEEENVKPKQSSRKLVCPGCELPVRVTRDDVHLMCMDCKLEMEYVD